MASNFLPEEARLSFEGLLLSIEAGCQRNSSFLTHFTFVDCVNSDSCYCDPEVTIQSCHVFFCATTVVCKRHRCLCCTGWQRTCCWVSSLCFSIRPFSVSFDRCQHSQVTDRAWWLKEKSLQRHLHVSTPHCVKCLVVSCILTDSFWHGQCMLVRVSVAVDSLLCNSLVVDLDTDPKGAIAQWLEQLTADQQVPGSIPGGGHGLLSWQDPTIWRIQRIRWSTAWARLQEIQLRW